MNTSTPQAFGEHLRHWRQHRRLSQLDLAQEAEVSTRHLSFLETGRSVPSREMVLRLSARLDIPLRERNALLAAAGYAPMYRERPLGDPALSAARQAVELILKSHEPQQITATADPVQKNLLRELRAYRVLERQGQQGDAAFQDGQGCHDGRKAPEPAREHTKSSISPEPCCSHHALYFTEQGHRPAGAG